MRGRIIDVTKQTLPGASIYIEKLTHRSDKRRQRLLHIPQPRPGNLYSKGELRGLLTRRTENHHPAGRTLEKDVILNEGVELQEVVVGGAFQGQRRAINAQKSNLGITNVVSADQVASFPTPTSAMP